MPSRLIAHLAVGGEADELFADAPTFASPYADYDERAIIVRIFDVMPSIFERVEPLREYAEPDRLALIARVAIVGRSGEALLEERYAADGRVVAATIMVRPLSTAKVAIAAMKTALDSLG